jgi:hypothetical protein
MLLHQLLLDADTIIIYSVYLPNFKNLKSELETF